MRLIRNDGFLARARRDAGTHATRCAARGAMAPASGPWWRGDGVALRDRYRNLSLAPPRVMRVITPPNARRASCLIRAAGIAPPG